MLNEKFTTCDDLSHHLNNVSKKMFRVQRYISFMLNYSYTYASDPILLLREFYNDRSEQLRDQLVDLTRAAHVDFVRRNNNGVDYNPTVEETDEALEMLLSLDGDNYLTNAYIYPWPRAKFQAQFFNDIFPSNARTYLNVLSDRGYLWFKKTYTLYIEKELEDDMVPLLFSDPISVASSLDLGQIIDDLQANVAFYKQHYIQLQNENAELRKTIDQISTEITSQSLTRWY